MRAAAIDIFLAIAVVSAWLAGIGFLRCGTSLAKLHWVAFVNTVTGAALTVSIWLHDGFSDRALKTLAILVLLLVAGPATTHAAGRAIFLRGRRTR